MNNIILSQQMVLSIQIMCKTYNRIIPPKPRRIPSGGKTWHEQENPYELSKTRWNITCTIERLLLSSFKVFSQDCFRNHIIEVSHLLEKTIFNLSTSASLYKDKKTLMRRIRCCARAYALRMCQHTTCLFKYLPMLQDRPTSRCIRRMVDGAKAA